MRKILKYLGLFLLVVILGAVIAGFVANQPMPEGKSGPEADALARKMEVAVNKAAWDSTRFVSWTFRTGTKYLWDKDRQAVAVEWDDFKVLLRTTDKGGRAFQNGTEITEATQKQELLAKAWANFANDSFWLCAPMKAFNPGTKRELVDLPDGGTGLMVHYTSGGVTPGDSYLWHLDEDGLPKAWQMWVGIIPIGGMEFSWEDWTSPEKGRIAKQHNGVFGVPILDLEFPEFSSAENPLRPLWRK